MFYKEMLTNRRKQLLIPLCNGKGDTKKCSSYRSLKMFEQTVKVVERVFKWRIQRLAEIGEIQMG